MRCWAISLSLNGFYDDVLAGAETCHVIRGMYEKLLRLQRLSICCVLKGCFVDIAPHCHISRVSYTFKAEDVLLDVFFASL